MDVVSPAVVTGPVPAMLHDDWEPDGPRSEFGRGSVSADIVPDLRSVIGERSAKERNTNKSAGLKTETLAN